MTSMLRLGEEKVRCSSKVPLCFLLLNDARGGNKRALNVCLCVFRACVKCAARV